MADQVTIRPATPADCPAIAKLFRISSDGVADYIWQGLEDEYPGLKGEEIGAERYAREDTAFSYENCLMAEQGGEVVAMLHSFVMEVDSDPLPEDFDPVLRPYAELEEDQSLYISGIAVEEEARGQGIGRALMIAADRRAEELDCPSISLIVFEQNEGAKRLYDRLGFKETARRAVVPHPLIHFTGDALLMVRLLD